MTRIGICDDEPIILDKIYQLLTNIIQKNKDNVIVEMFTNPHELLKCIINKKKIYNVLLLDIDMPQMSGFDVANRLNELSQETLVIFITSHNELVYDSFRYQPFRYIRKSVMEMEIEEAFRSAINNLSNDSKYYFCKSQDENVRLEYDNILYFELVNRRIIFNMKDGSQYYSWTTITRLIEIFSEHGFVQIHSGAVVNIKYIRSFSKKDVKLDNGTRLPVSRGRSKEVVLELSRYWGNKI